MKKINGMIDVGAKGKTRRVATSRAYVKTGKDIRNRIKNDEMPKGNVLEFARTAGILGAKNTFNIIPLCHIIEIEQVTISFDFTEEGIIVECTAAATAKTGVEMEAMVGCNIAAMTIYDMSKMFSKTIEITDSYLLEKSGGKSGHFKRED